MAYEEFPVPTEETRSWIAEKRPDMLEHFERMCERDLSGAIELLIAVAFTAGREYGERKNAFECVDHWHCDPPHAFEDCENANRDNPCPSCGGGMVRNATR